MHKRIVIPTKVMELVHDELPNLLACEDQQFALATFVPIACTDCRVLPRVIIAALCMKGYDGFELKYALRRHLPALDPGLARTIPSECRTLGL